MKKIKTEDKPFTIVIKELGGWWTAICPELEVSGFGSSEMEAINSVKLCMSSTLLVWDKILNKSSENIVNFKYL